MSDTFNLSKGSDFSVNFLMPDGAGGVADLTGYTIGIFDPHLALAGKLQAEITDAAGGEITLSMPWDSTLRDGRVMHFRLMLTAPGGGPETSNLLWVNIE